MAQEENEIGWIELVKDVLATHVADFDHEIRRTTMIEEKGKANITLCGVLIGGIFAITKDAHIIDILDVITFSITIIYLALAIALATVVLVMRQAHLPVMGALASKSLDMTLDEKEGLTPRNVCLYYGDKIVAWKTIIEDRCNINNCKAKYLAVSHYCLLTAMVLFAIFVISVTLER